MTKKGESNHYNVKLVKSYGFSIKVKDNKLVFKNSYDPFNEPEVKDGIQILKESLIQINENPLTNEAKLSKRYYN